MERRTCSTCKSRYVRKGCEPCSSCRLSGKDHPNWEPKDPFKYVELGPDVESVCPTISEKRRAVIDAMIELARRYGCELYVKQAYDFNNPVLELAFLENDEGRKTILALGFKLDEVKFKPYSATTSNLKLDDEVVNTISEALEEKLSYAGKVLENMDVNSLYPYKPNKEILRQLSNYAYGFRPNVPILDEMVEHCKKDVEATKELYEMHVRGKFNMMRKPEIKKVHFNDPVTVVIWKDGTKTIVRAQNGEKFDPEKGLAMAISKKVFGNKGNYFDEFKKWLPEEKKEKASTVIGEATSELDDSGLKVMVTPTEAAVKAWKALEKAMDVLGEVCK